MHGESLLRCFARCSAAALVLVAEPRPTAASDFTVSVGGNLIQGPAPVSDSFVTADTTAMARAGPDVGIFLEARALQTNTFTSRFAGTEAMASVFVDDVVITGPTPTVETAFHVVYAASFSDARETWSGDLGPFSSSTQQSATFLAAWSGGDSQAITVELDPEAGRIEVSHPGSFEQTIHFGDFDIPLESSGPQGTYVGFYGIEAFELAGELHLAGEVPTGQPFYLELTLFGRANADAFFLAGASARNDIFNSFGLRPGVVFELPAGYTADSPGLGIVDNVIVPEPASAAPIAAAVLCALAVARGRYARAAARARTRCR